VSEHALALGELDRNSCFCLESLESMLAKQQVQQQQLMILSSSAGAHAQTLDSVQQGFETIFSALEQHIMEQNVNSSSSRSFVQLRRLTTSAFEHLSLWLFICTAIYNCITCCEGTVIHTRTHSLLSHTHTLIAHTRTYSTHTILHNNSTYFQKQTNL
jgi:hypothetical protein